MCEQCWDADERKIYVGKEGCDGKLIPFLTLGDMRKRLVNKWTKTKQTEHRVYSDAIFSSPSGEYSWTETVDQAGPVNFKVTFLKEKPSI